MQVAMAKARIHECADSFETQLLAYAISVKISCEGTFKGSGVGLFCLTDDADMNVMPF